MITEHTEQNLSAKSMRSITFIWWLSHLPMMRVILHALLLKLSAHSGRARTLGFGGKAEGKHEHSRLGRCAEFVSELDNNGRTAFGLRRMLVLGSRDHWDVMRCIQSGSLFFPFTRFPIMHMCRTLFVPDRSVTKTLNFWVTAEHEKKMKKTPHVGK